MISLPWWLMPPQAPPPIFIKEPTPVADTKAEPANDLTPAVDALKKALDAHRAKLAEGITPLEYPYKIIRRTVAKGSEWFVMRAEQGVSEENPLWVSRGYSFERVDLGEQARIYAKALAEAKVYTEWRKLHGEGFPTFALAEAFLQECLKEPETEVSYSATGERKA